MSKYWTPLFPKVHIWSDAMDDSYSLVFIGAYVQLVFFAGDYSAARAFNGFTRVDSLEQALRSTPQSDERRGACWDVELMHGWSWTSPQEVLTGLSCRFFGDEPIRDSLLRAIEAYKAGRCQVYAGHLGPKIVINRHGDRREQYSQLWNARIANWDEAGTESRYGVITLEPGSSAFEGGTRLVVEGRTNKQDRRKPGAWKMSSEPWSFELDLPPGALRISTQGHQPHPSRKPGLSPEVAQQVARGTGAYTDDLLEIFREYAQGCRTWSFRREPGELASPNRSDRPDYLTLTIHRPSPMAEKVKLDLLTRSRVESSLEIDLLELCAGLVTARRTTVPFVIPGSDAVISPALAQQLCEYNMLGIE